MKNYTKVNKSKIFVRHQMESKNLLPHIKRDTGKCLENRSNQTTNYFTASIWLSQKYPVPYNLQKTRVNHPAAIKSQPFRTTCVYIALSSLQMTRFYGLRETFMIIPQPARERERVSAGSADWINRKTLNSGLGDGSGGQQRKNCDGTNLKLRK